MPPGRTTTIKTIEYVNKPILLNLDYLALKTGGVKVVQRLIELNKEPSHFDSPETKTNELYTSISSRIWTFTRR